MTEETAKALAAAMEKLAAAINKLPREQGSICGGILVSHQHQGLPSAASNFSQPFHGQYW